MNINKKITDLIQTKQYSLHDFFIYSEDGRQVYNNSNSDISLGVLVAGIWQASQDLHGRLGFLSNDNLQLNFSNSKTGIFITAIESSGAKYLMGCFYENELNPGRLKNLIKNSSFEVSKILNSKLEQKRKDDEFLFKNISDVEINQLFSTIGI